MWLHYETIHSKCPCGFKKQPLDHQEITMRLANKTSIILNGSVISVLGNPGYAAYAASKAGVRAMARVMASELSPRNIRVNVVSPGGTSTPIWSRIAPTPEAVAAL